MTINERWDAIKAQCAIFLANQEYHKYNELCRLQQRLIGFVPLERIEDHLEWLDRRERS